MQPNADSTVILSRALCRFDFIPPHEGVSGGQAIKAARLIADSRAPFPSADSAVVKGKAGIGLWWWDIERVSALLGPNWEYRSEQVVPETLLHASGKGCRQVAVADGIEAQCWIDDTLTASVWRRRAFTSEQWISFVRSAVRGATELQENKPEPITLSLEMSGIDRIPRARAPTEIWPLVEKVAIGACCAALLGAAALIGRSVGYDNLAAAETAAAVKIAPDTKRAGKAGDLQSDASVVGSFGELQAQPPPLSAIAQMHELLRRSGAEVTEFSYDVGRLDVEMQMGAGASLDAIASAVEADPWFAEVMPDFDNATGRGRLVTRVCRPSAAKGADIACTRAPRQP